MNLDSDWSRTNNWIVLFLFPPYTVSMHPCWAVVLPKCRGKWITIRPWWMSLLQWWLSQTCLLVLRIPLWITWAPAFCNILWSQYSSDREQNKWESGSDESCSPEQSLDKGLWAGPLGGMLGQVFNECNLDPFSSFWSSLSILAVDINPGFLFLKTNEKEGSL